MGEFDSILNQVESGSNFASILDQVETESPMGSILDQVDPKPVSLPPLPPLPDKQDEEFQRLLRTVNMLQVNKGAVLNPAPPLPQRILNNVRRKLAVVADNAIRGASLGNVDLTDLGLDKPLTPSQDEETLAKLSQLGGGIGSIFAIDKLVAAQLARIPAFTKLAAGSPKAANLIRSITQGLTFGGLVKPEKEEETGEFEPTERAKNAIISAGLFPIAEKALKVGFDSFKGVLKEIFKRPNMKGFNRPEIIDDTAKVFTGDKALDEAFPETQSVIQELIKKPVKIPKKPPLPTSIPKPPKSFDVTKAPVIKAQEIKSASPSTTKGIKIEPSKTDIPKPPVNIGGSGKGPDLPVKEPPFNNFSIPEESTKDRIIRKVQDKFRRVLVTQRAAKKSGIKIAEKEDTYRAQELFHGKTEFKLKKTEDEVFSPLIKEINKQGTKIDDVEKFLYAKHAPERNARIQSINPKFREKKIPGSGLSDEEAQKILADFDKKGLTPKLEAVASKVKALNKKRLEILKKEGLESEETIALWEKAYKDYIPLKGLPNEAGTTIPKVGKGFDIRGKESKRALGRISQAENLLTNSVSQLNETIVRAEKNKVGKAFLNFVRKNPNKDLWEVNKVSIKPRFDTKSGEVIHGIDPRFKLADNVLSVKEAGKEFHITIKDELLARALKNLGADKSGQIVQNLASFNRFLSAVNTQLVPEFVISNFSRDIQTAGINLAGEKSLKIASLVAKDTPKAMKGAFDALRRRNPKDEWVKWFNEFSEEGGRIGFFGLETLEQTQRKIINSLKLSSPGSKASMKRLFKNTMDLVSDVNSAVENGVRLSTYKNLRVAGFSKAEAASAAKNITVNFNRKGELGQTLNALFLFSNAGIQGTSRLFNALGNKSVQKIALGISTGSYLLTEMNRLIAGEDKDGINFYDKIPDWIRENNLIIMKADGNGGHYKIPVPYGYNVFHVLGQSVSNISHGNDKLKESMLLGRAVANAFNPLGGDASLLQLVSPTVTDPFLQVGMNENFFGAPIKPQRLPGDLKPESQLKFRSASKTSTKVAEFLNDISGGSKVIPGKVDFSPEVLDHFLEFFSGGTGRFINQSINVIASLKDEEPLAKRKIPFVRRVVGEKPEFFDNQRFNENFKKLKRLEKEMERIEDTENKVKSIQFKNKHKKEFKALEIFKKNESEITKLKKEKRKLESEKSPSKFRITQLDDRIRELIFNANRALEKGDVISIAREKQRKSSSIRPRRFSVFR